MPGIIFLILGLKLLSDNKKVQETSEIVKQKYFLIKHKSEKYLSKFYKQLIKIRLL